MPRRPCRLARVGAVCLAAWLIVPCPAAGQKARAEEHEQQQAAKAGALLPPRPNIGERVIDTMKRLGLIGRAPTGVHPIAASLYPGGWLAVGAGYRRPFLDSGTFAARAAWSLKNYRGVDAEVRPPSLAHGRMHVIADTRWLDAPDVASYGVGNETRHEGRTSFRYRAFETGVTATLAAQRHLELGGGTAYVTVREGPAYMRSRAFAAYDWRATPGYTGSGGLYRVEVQEHSAVTLGTSAFRRLDVEAAQLIPLLSANWAVAVRAAASFTGVAPGGTIPVYLLPSLGGNDSLRGYPSFRFRDRHRLLLSTEYRWTPARFLDMAIFYDTGRVAARAADLRLRGLKSSYGIGARFHGVTRTVLRLELARPDEGPVRFVFATNTAF